MSAERDADYYIIWYDTGILKHAKITKLLSNSRFYVVAGSVLLSIFILMYVQVTVFTTSARYIRLQEVYGLVALIYWYAVLLMSAIAKLIAKKAWMQAVLFTRRAVGGMVAYFAFLHAYVAFIMQLDGFSGIKLLPQTFFWALVLGVVSLAVLVCMALLSVDRIVHLLHFKQWGLLQRISYGAGILAIVHVWIIGSHVGLQLVQILVFLALALLFGLQSWNISMGLRKTHSASYARGVGACIWIVLCVSLIGMKLYVVSYSKSHTRLTPQGALIHAH